MKKSFLSLILFISWPLLATDCDIEPQHLGARYLMHETSVGQEHNLSNTIKLNLWRRDTEVAHQYVDNQVTEIWNLVSDGRVRPVRYFDEYRRGIEYQPSELNSGRGDRDWQSKNVLISKQLFEQLELVGVEGEGCDLIETYSLTNNKGQIDLVWLPAVDLIKRYRQETESHISEWHLEEIMVPPGVDDVFDERAVYQTTDYADIGDNETDPFLRQMINLGFVSHGASGFYNADGQALGHGHH